MLETEFGRLDGLLHNAALFEGLTPIANFDIELWYRILQVNLNALFMLTQALLGVLNRSTDASVVFTADRVSEIGQAYWGAYAVAKGGVQTLMKLLASELETNTPIRVNSVDPGRVRTAMTLKIIRAANRSNGRPRKRCWTRIFTYWVQTAKASPVRLSRPRIRHNGAIRMA